MILDAKTYGQMLSFCRIQQCGVTATRKTHLRLQTAMSTSPAIEAVLAWRDTEDE